MNSNQINHLKTVLRKYGNKNSETIVRQETGMKYSQFLECAESIYVISRIQSCYKDQRMVSLLTKANIEWIGIVIDNGWCTPLLPWIEKYGVEITKKSIFYLMENNLWDTYRKTDYLRMKATDHYKGFNAIDEAAAFIKDQANEMEEKESIHVEQQGEAADSNPGNDTSNAYDACERMAKKMESVKDELFVVMEYIVNNSDNCEYRKAMDELRAKLEQANETIDKQRVELEAKRNDINNLQLMAAEKNDELTELQNIIDEYNANKIAMFQTITERDDKIKELSIAIKLTKDELEKSRSEKPKKKVIPESGLRELPLVGDKMLRGLAPFLEKYNIIIDPKK